MVPDGWDLVEAQDICQRISVGIVVKPKDYYVPEGEGVKAFRSANVREGYIEDSNWTYISDAGHQNNKKSILQTGDVLIVRTGYPGTACVVPEQYAGANCIDIIFARPDQTRVLPEYLCDFTNSEYGKKQVLGGQGGLAQQHFNVGAYNKLRVPLPPLPEQKKIAEILSTWDKAIETAEALLATARTQKRALMQALLTGKHRFPEFEGQEWREVRLGEVFTERSERGGDGLPLLAITGGRGIIPQSETDRRDTSREDKSSYKQIHAGDIGYNSMRMWQGVSALSTLSGLVSPAYTIVVPRTEILPEFAKHLFKLPEQVHLFRRYSQGLTSDTWNLKFTQFADVPSRIPSLEEQQRISDVLEVSDHEIAAFDLRVDKLRTEKKALMQQLLTGKRRVALE